MQSDVHIIGGGIIGLCSAYYLQQAGYRVTVLDRGDFSEGCSHGNAGMIVPSHFVPLATPGVIGQGLKWLFSSRSPFYIRPRLDRDLLHWLWQFYRASTAERAARAMPVLRDYHQLSKSLYKSLEEQLGDFHFTTGGLLMLYRTAHGEKEEVEQAERANKLGVKADVMSPAELATLETGTRLQVRGGVYYPGDAHLYPNRLLTLLQDHLRKAGVSLRGGADVTDLKYAGDKVQRICLRDGEEIPVNNVVLAGGSWSAQLARKVGLTLLLQDGKGYSLTQQQPAQKPNIPAILVEDKVAITPMGNDLRIGGTLEISGLRSGIDQNRLRGIVEAVPRYYPNVTIETTDLAPAWSGFRPCTPDGLPYVGYSPTLTNLLIATGHAMMGLSLGPATGLLVRELLEHQPNSLPLRLFDPGRYN